MNNSSKSFPKFYQNHSSDSQAERGTLVLVGLDSIAKAVGAGENTIRRWIREEHFPARRCSDGIYRAEPDAVRRWFNLS